MSGQAFVQINWIAVALGAVFNMALGTLWYGPLFGKAWVALMGKKEDEIQSSPAMYLVPLVMAFISALVLAFLIEALGITVWWQGIGLGAILWTGIGATAGLTTSFFEDKKKGVWLLFALYQFVVFVVQGLVFAIW